MSHLSLPLSQRRKLLLGLATVKRHCPRKLYRSVLIAAFILMLLPWGCVVASLVASWRTFALGDETEIPLWAWVAVVVLPVVAWGLAKMFASRICTQWYIKKSVKCQC